MAGSSLFALIDDIASLLDDVAAMTKLATKKTAGVLGDDLALNAQQVTGVRAERELPVVWAVTKGSVVNKAILVPAALAISAFLPWAIVPLLMLGGAFLCFEGVEKLVHTWLHRAEVEADRKALVDAVANPEIDLVALERDKIKGAIRTDFVLSAEIIVIALGTVATASFSRQLGTLVGISLVMTIGVYGLVAGIVKLDDLGLYLTQRASAAKQAIGRGILYAAPWLMKFLSVAGTAAMFLVGGGILVHGIGPLHHWVQATMPALGGFALPAEMAINAGVGIAAGSVLVALWMGVQKARRGRPGSTDSA